MSGKPQQIFGPQRIVMGDRLRRWRLERNMSAATLGEVVDVSSSVITGYEGGTMPHLVYAAMICIALDHTLDDLLEGVIEGVRAERGKQYAGN